MRGWEPGRVAEAAGAQLIVEPHRMQPRSGGHALGPQGASVDSRSLQPGELFVGLRGEREDGGSYGADALAAGAWGVLVTPAHARALAEADHHADAEDAHGGVVLAHEDPLRAAHALARAWRRELGARGAKVIAITGSTGKTSTKDILAALLGAHLRVAASPANLNTEIGLPLALLAAPESAEVVVLEMAMRGEGQIAQLTAIAEPDVGVIVNIGPAHLGLLGSLEAIAAAKAELIAGLAPAERPGAPPSARTPVGIRGQASVVVPANEPLLARHLRAEVPTITFGEAGDVRLAERRPDGSVLIVHGREEIELWPSFAQAHNIANLLAAVAAARALGHTPGGRVEVEFSAMRGQREVLASGATLIDDCYNANPMSMRAAIDDLAETAPGRSVAVLGDMLELGADAPRWHREIGAHATARNVQLVVAVGPLAAEMAATFAGEIHRVADAPAAAELVSGLLRGGDTVLVKGSRGVGLEHVVAALRAAGEPASRQRSGAGGAGEAGSGAGGAGARPAVVSAAAPGRR